MKSIYKKIALAFKKNYKENCEDYDVYYKPKILNDVCAILRGEDGFDENKFRELAK